MKLAFGIEYDGSAYHGWQSQVGVQTVQACLEKALSVIANQSVKVICAGRTDTGVHGLGQVVHIETTTNRKKVHGYSELTLTCQRISVFSG